MRHRIRCGLSQSEIAGHFGYTSSQFISNIERGISFVPIDKIKALCKLLNIDKNDYLKAYYKDLKIIQDKHLKEVKRLISGP
jgi:transcriptional regulator with XRE-family HTH domain